MIYGSPMMPPARGVPGMPPGQRPFMPPYCQAGNRPPGAYPGMPQGQTASPQSGMPHPHPHPGLSPTPYPNSPGGTHQGMPPMYMRPPNLPPGDGSSHYAHAYRLDPLTYLNYGSIFCLMEVLIFAACSDEIIM